MAFCSSKTAAEVQALLSDIGLRLPFITENGGAIFLPEPQAPHRAWSMIPLGTARTQVLRVIASVRNEVPAVIRGFADMTEDEVAALCGFTARRARLAMLRDFDEPITVNPATPENLVLLRTALKGRGLTLTRGGRFFHVMGAVDKGMAVKHMTRLVKAEHKRAWSIGIGDSANDLPMLQQVDLPLLVQRPEGTYDRDVVRRFSHLIRIPLPGPEGWAAALTILLDPDADSPGRAAALLRKGFNL